MARQPERAEVARFPVVSRGAEHLAMGQLMRRNILTYPAPPFNEGYDLICMHPDPRHKGNRVVKIQVKSRLATDSNGFYVHSRTLKAFDYLIVVVMNLGDHFRRGADGRHGAKASTLYTLPVREIRRRLVPGKREKVLFGSNRRWLSKYEDDKGLEQIADDLMIPYPVPPRLA
jgi:hypothetical protein